MKKLDLFIMYFVLFLFTSQSWAGKQFNCTVPLTTEIVNAINAIPDSHTTSEIFDGNKYMIKIYSTNQGDAYTNIAVGPTASYVHNGVVQEIYGSIDGTHKYAAYLNDSITEGMFATWDFVFFNPRDVSDITKRYFVAGVKCSALGYDAQTPGMAEGVPPGIIQIHNPARVIEKNFTNLYALYNTPEAAHDMERDISCFRPTEYLMVAGAIIFTACTTWNYLNSGK